MEKTMDKENDKKQDQHVDEGAKVNMQGHLLICLLYTSPSPRD